MSRLLSSRDELLERGIVQALVFYDMFDYPLTLTELSKYLQDNEGRLAGQHFDLSEIVLAFKHRESLKRKVAEAEGFYFLRGRAGLVEQRLNRHRGALPRWKKAVRLIRLLSGVPFLKMVALCNMFPIETPRAESDIDVVIIAQHGRLWLVRVLVTVLIALTGQWRHKKVAGKICLSFFISDRHLDLQKLYQDKNIWLKKDPYLLNWIALLFPVYDRDGTAEKFWAANQWIKQYLPQGYLTRGVSLRQAGAGAGTRAWQKWWEFVWGGRFGDWLERTTKWWQWEYMKARGDPEWLKNPNVIRSDEVLKFHEIDRREYFRRKFEERLMEAYR